MLGILEILGVLIAVTGIATFARGRGASPMVAGAVAVVGYVLLRFGGGFVLRNEDDTLWLLVAAWAWIALVAGFFRFVVGASRPKPDGKWSCSNCHFLNNASSVICEACKEPWRPRGEPASSERAV